MSPKRTSIANISNVSSGEGFPMRAAARPFEDALPEGVFIQPLGTFTMICPRSSGAIFFGRELPQLSIEGLCEWGCLG